MMCVRKTGTLPAMAGLIEHAEQSPVKNARALWRPAVALLFAAVLAGVIPVARAESPLTGKGVSAVRRVNQLVGNIDAVLPFYRDLLGFRVVYDVENSSRDELSLLGVPATRARVVALQAPRRDIAGGLLSLVQVLEPAVDLGAGSDSRTSLLLLTDDAEALFKRLTDAGVNILSGMTSYQAARTTGTTYAFTVADPTGLRITFAQLAGPVPE